jgi:hypothetical protein
MYEFFERFAAVSAWIFDLFADLAERLVLGTRAAHT